jgi:hypothetical protein
MLLWNLRLTAFFYSRNALSALAPSSKFKGSWAQFKFCLLYKACPCLRHFSYLDSWAYYLFDNCMLIYRVFSGNFLNSFLTFKWVTVNPLRLGITIPSSFLYFQLFLDTMPYSQQEQLSKYLVKSKCKEKNTFLGLLFMTSLFSLSSPLS